MTSEVTAPLTGAISAPVRPKGTAALWRVVTNPIGMAAILFLLLVVAMGLLAPWLAPTGPNTTDLASVNARPFSPGHLLGADSSGRDILSRLMWGTQGTLLGSVIVLVVSLGFGVTSGLLAGYYQKGMDAASTFVSDVIMALPGIVLLIALYSLTGPNIPVAMAVFGLFVAPGLFRLVRAVVASVRSELYVDAAKVVGLSDARIIGRHVLSAVRAPILIQSSFILAGGIAIQAGLDFLGLGDPAQPSWGRVLQEAFNGIYSTPENVFWPALLISLTIMAFVLLGNVVRDVLQATSRLEGMSQRRRRRLVDEFRSSLPATSQDSGVANEEAVLSIRGLRIGYPETLQSVKEVVHGVDLDVKRGEIHGLVGESGSGKSQIAFSVLGILPAEAMLLGGTIHVGGKDLLADRTAMKAARGRTVAYIPQEPVPNLDPSFTVGAQLVQGLRAVTSLSRKEAKERIRGLLERVGIVDPERVMGLYPHEISGGMAQRILICGAVAAQPDLIIADEPTTALDVTVQAEVLHLLRQLSKEQGLGMILVTHNLGVVADICDTVSVMKDGLIVERSDVRTLFASPAEPYTRRLLESSRRTEIKVQS